MAIFLRFLVVVLCVTRSFAFITRVRANTEECFFQNARVGEKVWGSFRVTTGGQLDINLLVSGPNDYLIYAREKENEGTFTFIAQEEGIHQVCFSNKMSAVSQKTVSFNLHVGTELLVEGIAKKEHLTPLENALDYTSIALQTVHDEQRYLKARERRARSTNESTNSRVLWWSILQAVVCVGMALWQIYYLKSFFEQKRSR
uniref:GOLD domain-containing protein n=1 Tax=Hirondellea gigas TaxID=1518452 RepID=A0A6A7G9G4_9CRUS